MSADENHFFSSKISVVRTHPGPHTILAVNISPISYYYQSTNEYYFPGQSGEPLGLVQDACHSSRGALFFF